jgi:DNA-binding MarR family transcriptional regulator
MLDRFEQFSSFISGIYRSIQKLEREEMVKFGLKGAYAQYLVVMNRRNEGITSAELGEICEKDKAAVSRIVAEMEEKGLLTRVAPGGNLYRAQLFLTEKGTEAAQFVARRAQIAVEKAGEGLNDADRSRFYSALGLISSNLQDICKQGIGEE